MAQIATRQGRGTPRHPAGGGGGGGGRENRSSPWENEFRNRLLEFQRKEEEEEDELRPRALSTSSQSSLARRALPTTASFQGGVCKDLSQTVAHSRRRSSTASSPTPTATPTTPTTPTPPPPQRPGSRTSQTSARFMVDETGQKERILPDSQSSQSQSDDSEREDTLSQQLTTLAVQNRDLQNKIRDSERERERLSSLLETSHTYSLDISPGGKPLQSQMLDGRLLVQEERGKKSNVALPATHTRLLSAKHHFPEHDDDDDDEEEDEEEEGKPQEKEKGADDRSGHRHNMLSQNKLLQSEKRNLEMKLKETMERVDLLKSRVAEQQAVIADNAELNSDLQKDIEVLRNENSHVSAELGKVEEERSCVMLDNKELKDKLVHCEKRLAEAESMYDEADQQAHQLEEKLAAATRVRETLTKENEKLDQEVKDVRKTKDNFRSTITKLREQNTLLESKLSGLLHEKDSLTSGLSEVKQEQEQLQLKVNQLTENNKCLQLQTSQLEEKLAGSKEEKSSLSVKLEELESRCQRLKHELEESQWERGQLQQRLTTVTQREQKVTDQHGRTLDEIRVAIKDLRQKVPGLKEEKTPPLKVAVGNIFSHDVSAEINQFKSLLSAVTMEVASLRDQRLLLDVKASKLQTQLQEWETARDTGNKLRLQLEKTVETVQEENKQLGEVVAEFRLQLDQLGQQQDDLRKEKAKLQEQIKEQIHMADQRSAASSQQLTQLQAVVAERDSALLQAQHQVAHLLAERTCAVARLAVMNDQVSDEVNVEIQEQIIGDKTARIDQLTNQILELTSERAEYKSRVEVLMEQHSKALQELQQNEQEQRSQEIAHDKVKMQLMTEISLLRSKLSKLEEDNATLRLSRTGSAFYPVPGPQVHSDGNTRRVTFTPTHETSQQQITELQHKVSILEAENKHLLELAHSSSVGGLQDATLRRQLMELRRKQYFADVEKKQLSDKVATLQGTLRTVRESKEKNSSERFVALQEENASLHDRVRSLEESFTRKQMMADHKIAETMKENDRFRHKLMSLQQGLDKVKNLEHTITNIHSAVLSLNDMQYPSGPENELHGSLKQIVEIENNLQFLLTNQSILQASEQGDTQTLLATPTKPLSKQLSDTAASSTAVHPRALRSHSASSSFASSELRDKLTQLHSNSLLVAAALHQNKEFTARRVREIRELRDKLTSLHHEMKDAATQLHTAHDLLSHLHQSEVSPEQTDSIALLEKQVEKWQDKVIARDMALKDIDAQMRMDYESHDHTFSQLKSQLLSLREELSTKIDALHSRDQYIHTVEERCLAAENDCIALRKELDCAMQDVMKFQLSGHGGNIDVIQSQAEELHQLKSVFNDYLFELSELRGKLESAHRENTVLKQQTLDMERHHLQMREELHTNCDYLRQANLQLIELQSKDESVDVVEMVKRCQNTMREQRDTHKLATELQNARMRVRELEMRVAEQDHQLENHRPSVKLVQLHPPPADMMMVPQQHHKYKTMPSSGRGLRPHSADSRRTPHYNILTGYNHPKARVRRTLPHTLEGDFTIPLGDGPGDSLNLEQSEIISESKRYVGLPVVTDDDEKEGSSHLEHKQHRAKFRRIHRRTASTGSNFFSPDATPQQSPDTKPLTAAVAPSTAPPTSSAVPLSAVAKQQVQLAMSRPVSADSSRYETHTSPTSTTKPHPDRVGLYARNVAETIDKLSTKSDEENVVPKGRDKTAGGVTNEKQSKGDLSSKFRLPWFRSGQNKGSASKNSAAGSGTGNKLSESTTTGNDPPSETSACQQSESSGFMLESTSSQLTNKQANDDTSSSGGGNSAQVSRMPSMASSVGRSDSFVSTSTTFSGRESSPYSTVSNDSLLIPDSIDSLQQLSSFNIFNANRFTPILYPHYLTSSSDEDNRSYPTSKVTLRPSTSSVSTTSSQLFQPLGTYHHRANSSCDSDQLQSQSDLQLPHYVGSIPPCPAEGPCISDIEQCSTDEDLHDKIRHLTKKLGRVRRSSTGSITIFNSGGSMEDIKTGI